MTLLQALPSSAALGVGLAVVGTLAWASHYLFIRVGTDRRPVSDVVLAAIGFQAGVVAPVAVAVHYPSLGPRLGLTAAALGLFAAAGVASGLLGRVCQYASIRRVGASRTSPVVTSAGLVSVALAVVVLGEQLTPLHLLGVLLVLVGVVGVSWETTSGPVPDSVTDVAAAFAFALGAAGLYGLEPILVKLGLGRGTPALVGLAVMAVTATLGLSLYRRATGGVDVVGALTGPGSRHALAAGLVGAVAQLFYLRALSVAPVVLVLPIFQTTPLVVAVLSLAFMPHRLEQVTWKLGVAAAVVVAGATLVALAGT